VSDRFVCFGLGQLAHIDGVWLDCCSTQRPRQGRVNEVICADFQRTSAGLLKPEEQLGGIVVCYEREAA
jgi:putative transposase